jgi:hypothetical protein
MPVLPFFYQEFIEHFCVLSRSRHYYSEVVPTKTGGMSITRKPNPIDLTNILSYNEKVAKVLSDRDFIDIIQTLDSMYIEKAHKR